MVCLLRIGVEDGCGFGRSLVMYGCRGGRLAEWVNVVVVG